MTKSSLIINHCLLYDNLIRYYDSPADRYLPTPLKTTQRRLDPTKIQGADAVSTAFHGGAAAVKERRYFTPQKHQ